LAVDRETDQREANGRAGQHLETEGPAKWIHGCLLLRSRAALSLLRAVARTSAASGREAFVTRWHKAGPGRVYPARHRQRSTGGGDREACCARPAFRWH